MKEQVLEIVQSIRPDVDFMEATDLIDGGTLESLDIVAIVGELNDAFDIEISVDDLLPENFNTLDAMVQLVEAMQE